jgi:hypothetical protein
MSPSSSPNAEASAPPTETSPLLSELRTQNGILGDEGNSENGSVDTAKKKHPMADKMHILFPAIGVGVSQFLPAYPVLAGGDALTAII